MTPFESLLHFFRELPDFLKLIVFLALLLILVYLAVRARERKKELRRKNDELAAIREERDQLLARFAALDQIDSHVWTKPDAFGKNRFVPRSQRPARIVALCNLKGGVGKTTLTLNLGVTLALQGKRVLLVDLDFQGTLSNISLTPELVQEYRGKGWTTETLLSDQATARQACDIMFPMRDAPQCRIMLAREKLELREFEEQSRFFVDPQHEVRFSLQRVLHDPEISNRYDYVLLDCPPRMTTACINALASADYLLIPTTLSQMDIEAVPRTLNWLKELHAVVQVVFLGAVITRARTRMGELVSYEKTQLGKLKSLIQRQQPGEGFIFSAIIADSPKIHQSTADGKAAVAHLPEVRDMFDAIARELEGKAVS